MNENVAPTSTSALRWRVAMAGAAAALLGGGLVASRALRPSDARAAVRAPAPVDAPPRSPKAPSPSVDAPPSEVRAALGKAIFFDERLSEPAGTSCASCHDPAYAFAGTHGSNIGVPLGSRPDRVARRSTPSVLYLKFVRRYHVHWEEDAPLIDAYGGFFWDGRSDSIVDLVRQPLLNPNEMNNADAGQIAVKLRSGAYAADFRREFGAAADDPEKALTALGQAVEAYLLSPAMSPFSSKYDDFIRGKVLLSPQEAQGLKLFKDSAKGGCSACHKLNDNIPNPERSPFTDASYDSVAIPRNMRLPANRDPQYFDLGVCQRGDDHYHATDPQFCGKFRTPSLRNVAVRPSYMHNGAFTKLRDVVSFYATRGTDPRRWYKAGPIFDDVPGRYQSYVNVDKAPYNRRKGQKPPLDDAEIDAIVAFLGTLTDAQFK